LEKIGDAYSLTEHDGTRLDGTITDTAHDYHHMTILQPDGTLHVTEEHNGHRVSPQALFPLLVIRGSFPIDCL